MIPHLRRATADDLPAISVTDGRAFGVHFSAEDLDDFRPLFEPDRFLLACDPADGAIIGVTGSFPFDVTLPGGATLAVPGVTWVSVAATHRRRGILRALMAEQHRGFVADGVAVALLTASEGGIYGRFGYGPAGRERTVEIERRRATFRPGAPDPGGVRFADTDEVRKLAPELHRRWCTTTPGALSRSERWWDNVLRDRERHRGEASAQFHLVHADGYATYRRSHSDRTCRISEVVAATDGAHAALWRVLLGLDLVDTVTSYDCPIDDPLPFLLTDPRQVRTTRLTDGLWARVLDVPAALSARGYAVELDVVLDVHDAFLPGCGGRFRLRGGPGGSTCEPVSAPADVHVEVTALGSLLFGTHRARSLARAGRLRAADPAVLARVDAAFAGERETQHGTGF